MNQVLALNNLWEVDRPLNETKSQKEGKRIKFGLILVKLYQLVHTCHSYLCIRGTIFPYFSAPKLGVHIINENWILTGFFPGQMCH